MTDPIRIEVDDAEVVALLARLRQAVTNLQPAMKRIGFALTELVGDSFNQGKDPWGNPWEPLSALTISRRRKGPAANARALEALGVNTSDKPLRDKGLMRASIEAIATDDGVTVSVGRKDRPAHVHQFGNPNNRFYNTPRGRPAPIPARPFLPIRNNRADLAGTEYQDVLLDVLDVLVAEAAR